MSFCITGMEVAHIFAAVVHGMEAPCSTALMVLASGAAFIEVGN